MIRRLKKKLRKPKQGVVPEEPLQRLEAFLQQIRLLQRDPKALGTPRWHMFSQGNEDNVDYNTAVRGWRGLGFTGWIIHTRFYVSPLGDLFQVWAVVDGDQQRIWYPRTGRTIPFSSLDVTPLIVYPRREEEGSQSGTRRVKYLYSLGVKLDIVKLDIEEQDIEYPGGVYREGHVEYGVMFDVADRPIVTDGVQFWWAWTKKKQPIAPVVAEWDSEHRINWEYFLRNLFREAELDKGAWNIPDNLCRTRITVILPNSDHKT